MAIRVKENELYREIELFDGDVKVGEAEVDIKGHMLSRLNIYEPYQNKGYGTEFVRALTERYGLFSLWVRSDNTRAIHVYEKCGYRLGASKMYEMILCVEDEAEEQEAEDAGRDVGESVFVLDGDGVTIARVPDDLDVEGDETDA